MKISLVQPKVMGNFACDIAEPLGLGYIASYLEKKGYNNIKIYPSIFYSDRKIVKETISSDVVGITANSPLMAHAKILAKKIKKVNDEIKIVLGGVHPSALPEETLRNKNIDFVVRGEGEVTFYELIKALGGRKNLESVKGISYVKEGTVYHNKERRFIENLDYLPFPNRELFLQESYVKKSQQLYGRRYISVLSSRGCIFRCKFCASSCIWRGKWRYRSAENVVKELRELINKYSVKSFQFADPVFTIKKERIYNLCNEIIKENLDISWGCLAHINTLDEDILRVMESSGCKSIGLGIESGSPEILNKIGKQINLSKIKEVFNIIKQFNIKTMAYFMIGFPGEDKHTIQESKQLIEIINPDYATCTIVRPYPGSEFYTIAKEKNYIDDRTDWSKVHYSPYPSMPLKYLNEKELNREYRLFIRKIGNIWLKKRINFWKAFLSGIKNLRFITPVDYKYLFMDFVTYIKLSVFG